MLLDIYTFREQRYIKILIRLHFLAKILHFPRVFSVFPAKYQEKLPQKPRKKVLSGHFRVSIIPVS